MEDDYIKSIDNVIKIMSKYANSDDITIDIVGFCISIMGLEGPIMLDAREFNENEKELFITIGKDGKRIKKRHILKFLKKIQKLLPKRYRPHYAGIHQSNKKIAFNAEKPTFRISWD